MTFAEFVLQVRMRATALGTPEPHTTIPATIIAFSTACNFSAGRQAEFMRRVVGAMIGIGEEEQFDVVDLDALSPRLLSQLDVLLDAMLAGHLDRDMLHTAVRPLIVRPVG